MNMEWGFGEGKQPPAKAYQHNVLLQGHFAGTGLYRFGYKEGFAPPPPPLKFDIASGCMGGYTYMYRHPLYLFMDRQQICQF